MNCRGITELVIANVGLQHGLITTLGYTVIVLPAAPPPVNSTRTVAPAARSRRT